MTKRGTFRNDNDDNNKESTKTMAGFKIEIAGSPNSLNDVVTTIEASSLPIEDREGQTRVEWSEGKGIWMMLAERLADKLIYRGETDWWLPHEFVLTISKECPTAAFMLVVNTCELCYETWLVSSGEEELWEVAEYSWDDDEQYPMVYVKEGVQLRDLPSWFTGEPDENDAPRLPACPTGNDAEGEGKSDGPPDDFMRELEEME